ncbi:unnamed protein product [Symbiodinium pilosum]|uniref:Uncharacterized protein n=1 Tax=Symbiodinium pilosum TaxID=2952 RepID=A0A812IZ02_SYMPI|nr:unnamed protein product [Symbiodinium pilosum]
MEEDADIRNSFRMNKSQLLAWCSPKLVGVASLKSLALNVPVIKLAIQIWGSHTSVPKTMPIDWLKQEVSGLHDLLRPGVSNRSVAVYVDSWGIKRLATLAMRRWKAPIGALRDSYLH